MILTIYKSKTDKANDVGLHVCINGNNSKVCALREFKNHLRLCGICCKLDFYRCENEHVFKLGNDALTWYFLSKMLNKLTSLTGLRGNFTSHSLHVGAVVALLLMNCPLELIIQLGKWTSLAFLDYIHILLKYYVLFRPLW